MKKVADGFIMLDRFGSYRTASWILYHRGEGVIVEMPPFYKNEEPPNKIAKRFFNENNIIPRYAFLSHAHWDHANSLKLFRNEFPNVSFVAHSSFLKDDYIKYVSKKGNNGKLFDEIFKGKYWKGHIGGEPIYLIHAPKHSPTDLMVVFRGAVITGDWYIGDLKDCNNFVLPEVKVKSIDNMKKLVDKLNYKIHMLFSAHGDCLFFDADFHKIMDETKIDHGNKIVNLPARYLTDSDFENLNTVNVI